MIDLVGPDGAKSKTGEDEYVVPTLPCGRPLNRARGRDFPKKASAAELQQGKNRINICHAAYQQNVHTAARQAREMKHRSKKRTANPEKYLSIYQGQVCN